MCFLTHSASSSSACTGASSSREGARGMSADRLIFYHSFSQGHQGDECLLQTAILDKLLLGNSDSLTRHSTILDWSSCGTVPL